MYYEARQNLQGNFQNYPYQRDGFGVQPRMRPGLENDNVDRIVKKSLYEYLGGTIIATVFM
eukprot:3935655-Rhodomonas_salina.1